MSGAYHKSRGRNTEKIEICIMCILHFIHNICTILSAFHLFFRHYHHPAKNRHSCIIHILQIEHLEHKILNNHSIHLLYSIHTIHIFYNAFSKEKYFLLSRLYLAIKRHNTYNTCKAFNMLLMYFM